jgi:hypothetical protein
MFFGSTNSPAMFQTMMDEIFRSLIHCGVMLIYINEILVFGGESLEAHQKIILEVMEILRQNHLYLKLEKCDFE